EWRRKLEHRGSIFQTNSDTEVIVHLIARSQARNLSSALGDALNQVEGAYSLLVLTQDELYAVRDPRGFRPLVLGKLTTPGGFVSWLVASETCAFDLLNAQYVREIEPGEMVRISKSGIESIHFAPEKQLQQCIFEHVYFSRPDSIIFGRSVNESRKIVRMVREVGAKEVHVRISCPPTISPCYYGVDTPTREELIASSNTPEEICKFLGADSLGYVSLPALRRAVGDTAGKFCTSCY